MRKFETFGQSLTELAVLVTIVTAAIFGMQLYLQRALQAKYKGGVDYSLGTAGISANRQYEPYYFEINRGVATTSSASGGYPNSAETSAATESGRVVTTTAQNDP
jgi:hypothetical protein